MSIQKYLWIAIAILALSCYTLYQMYDGTKTELQNIKIEKKNLEDEIKRRDTNEKELSKNLRQLRDLYDKNPDWSNTPVPSSIVMQLSKSCKACK